MSLRHRIATITLLSSSIAAAGPASPPRAAAKTAHAVLAPFIDAAAVRASKHHRASALTDDDGYPLVGNMHGKQPGPPEPPEPPRK
jgi:hypothetical protein